MKRHFEVLDGLRGTAALLVVVFHLQEALFHNYALIPLRHAYLAVDFFFLLSGYVVAYAYDDRLPVMRVRDFLRIRLIRLHPLVVLSAVIGALCYWFDPFAGSLQHVSLRHLLGNLAFGALLLPFTTLPNRYDETYPLNPPSWSLLQEYLANIFYVLVGPRLGRRALLGLALLAGVALVAAGLHHEHLHGGWNWKTFWMAPVRVAFPFLAGLLLYRYRISLPLRGAYGILSLLLLALFAAPAFKPAAPYELLCVLVFFPLIVAAGAGTGTVAGWLGRVCRFSGQLSYPLYLVHAPFVTIFGNWVNAANPTVAQALPVMVGVMLFCLLLAWAALRFYDEPVRAWLSARRKAQQTLQLQKAY